MSRIIRGEDKENGAAAQDKVNVINECGENLLHILLSRTKHNIKQTAELCKKLIDKGVNINQLDEKERVPLQYLITFTNERIIGQ